MIAFSGIDGAGKTTQIELLKDYFIAEGKKVIVFWSRGGYTPGMLYIKKIAKVSSNGSTKMTFDLEREKKRERSFSLPIVRKAWLILSIMDLFYYYVLYLRLKQVMGFTIICDRYIIDTEIDFKLNFPDDKFYNWWIWRFLNFCLVKPKKHFVATIPVDISMKRSKLKNEPFPDSKEVLENRLSRYRDYLSKSPAVHLEGLQTIDSIHALILENLKLTT